LQAQGLPQYAAEISAAQARLAAAEANETRVRLKTGYQGAARLHTKTVEEMAVDKGRYNA
jgi:alpha-galactosidase